MAFLQADAAKLTRNMLVRGVIEQIITESSVLRYLPFVALRGSGMTYNREATLGNSATMWHAVNGVWDEAAMTLNSITSTLQILGGDADVDQFLQQTYSNEQDIRAEVLSAKAKGLAYEFNDKFFNGDGTSNTMTGLKTTAGSVDTTNWPGAFTGTVRAASNGANGATLSLDDFDVLIDAVKPGKPDVLFCSKRTRRKLKSLRRASGNILETGVNQFAQQVQFYDGIPVEVDENISDAETQGSSTNCSSAYAVKLGFLSGVCGLQNGGIQVVPVGNLETKDAWRTRVKWYVGLAYFVTWSYARMAGIR